MAARLLLRLRPRVVFSTGGFVALPVVLAALVARVPVVVHEQTAIPGLANRIGARFARRIAVTFPETVRQFPADREVLTGNPLRADLAGGTRADAVARFGLDPTVPLVYVTGGAQGANAINRAVGTTLVRAPGEVQIVHQCGDNPQTGDLAWLEARRAALPAALARRYTILPWVGGELAGPLRGGEPRHRSLRGGHGQRVLPARDPGALHPDAGRRAAASRWRTPASSSAPAAPRCSRRRR